MHGYVWSWGSGGWYALVNTWHKMVQLDLLGGDEDEDMADAEDGKGKGGVEGFDAI